MKKRAAFAAWLLACAVTAFLAVFPVLYAFFGSFRTAGEFARVPPRLLPDSFLNFDSYVQVFTRVPMARFFLNSLATTVMVCAVKLSLAVMAAYAFAFYDFRFKGFLFTLLLATMMLPQDTVIVTNYQTVSRLNLTDTWLGVAVVSFAGASQMFMLRQAFIQSPRILRDAAYLDGCGDLRFLWTVLVPVCRPVIVTLLLQAFVAQWNAYLWPLLVTNSNEMRTVQVGITMLTGADDAHYQVVLAGACAAMTLPVALFVIVRRRLTGAMTRGAVSD